MDQHSRGLTQGHGHATASTGSRGPALLGRRHRAKRILLTATAGLLLLTPATTSDAVTKVTVANPGGLVAVGPVNSDYGFPAWYQDSAGVRVEPCINGDDPLCGFLPGDIPNPDAPLSFPDNWPGELFYQLVDSSLTLPGGGKATLTLGLEASFANGDPIQGDQITFARTRVTVVGGPANSTMTFKHPFGELTVDVDGAGKGRIVQDISPAVGNFSTALKGNFGPFLKWDPAVAPAAPAGYLGDPAQTHAVVGGKAGFNAFTALNANGTTLATTNQFGVSGKVATNTGVTGDYAVVNGTFLDVFASSTGDQLEVVGVDGAYAKTPLTNDMGSSRHYARVALTGTAPGSVTVRNLADKPMSTATIKVADVTVTQAEYDGKELVVAAKSSRFPLTVEGVGTLKDATPTRFPVAAPPAVVSVKSANGAPATFPVTISAGMATEPGLPPVPVTADPGTVTETTPDNPTQPSASAPVVSVATPADTLPGAAVTLDASATTGATTYQWTPVTVPAGTTISGDTTAKPTVTLPYFATSSATAPVAAWAPVTVKVTATNAAGVTEQEVLVGVKKDVTTIAAGARHRVGTELRVDGTSLVDGQAGARTPATQVTIWNTTKVGAPVKLGTATVDTLGAWSLRPKPGPSVQVTSVLVQTSRGGTATSAVAR